MKPKLGWRQRRILEIVNPIVEKKRWFSKGQVEEEISRLTVRITNPIKRMAEEKRYWEAFHRLKRRGYITPVALVLKPNSSCIPFQHTTRIWVKGNPYWTLTEKGRKVAHKILREEKEEKHLREALNLLVKEGKTEATLNEIREKLWERSGESFRNREEFERYWTKKRLGLMLKRIGVNWRRTGKKRIRLYSLTGMQRGVDPITSKTHHFMMRLPAYQVYPKHHTAAFK